MKLHRIAAVFLRYLYLLRSSPTRILSLYIWVIIDIVLWGFVSRYLTMVTPGFNFIIAFLGAIVLSDFFARVMLGVTMAFMEDSWSRNFLNVFATPLTLAEYLSGLVCSGIATSLGALLAMLLLAHAIFGLSLAAYGALFIPFVGILFLFGIALGIVGCAIMLRLGPAAEWFVWPIPALIAPFVGVLYPLSTLPHWMQGVAKLLPPSYVFESMRAMLAGRSVSSGSLWVSAGLAAIYIVLACFLFAAVHRHAVRTGLIARYSAETIS